MGPVGSDFLHGICYFSPYLFDNTKPVFNKYLAFVKRVHLHFMKYIDNRHK